MANRSLLRLPVTLIALMLMIILPLQNARASDTDPLANFLEITGFDVALESIRLSADAAPRMLGLEAADFGADWSRLVVDVFDTDIMHGMARDILRETLEEGQLTHATAFYGSDLGRRLVAAENESHMQEDDEYKSESGKAIIDGLIRIGSPRVALLTRLNAASDLEDGSIRAIQEVQVRFLMAAASAGVIELRMDEPDLREALRAQQGSMRTSIKANALANAAYTYQAFSDEEVAAYADALMAPRMQEVYALMNAVQYEIMANRFEEIAARLSAMQPSQDL